MKIKYDKPINNLIFLLFPLIVICNYKIFYLLFIYLITIKSANFNNINLINYEKNLSAKKRKSLKKHGFRSKMKTKGGRKLLKRRRAEEEKSYCIFNIKEKENNS